MSYLSKIIAKAQKQEEIQNYEYEISCSSPSDYELTLTIKADAKLIGNIWAKSKAAAMERKGINVKSHAYEEINQFEVPQVYFNFLKITMQKLVYNCADIFKQDGVILLNYEVRKATFKINEAKGWDIIIIVGGIYSRK